MEKRGCRALVAGAGIGGLAAAAAMSPYFHEVIIFEKDSLVDGPQVRKGANQGGHIHTMLRAGEAGLETLLPGIRQGFLDNGAVELDMGGDYRGHDGGAWRKQIHLDMPILTMSRPGYEQVLRNRVAALENIDIRSGCKVTDIQYKDGSAQSVRIIEGENEAIEKAELIIDARGRASLLPVELETAGFGRVPETMLGIVMCYVSGRFKRQPNCENPTMAMLVRPTAPERRYGILCPVEDGDWMVTLGGRADTVPPINYDGFCEYARQLAVPDFYDVFKDSDLVEPLRRYKKPTANWRHYDQLEEFPKGLIPLGDTITSINPTFGQGMTLAVLHAQVLAAALQTTRIDDVEFTKVYFEGAMKVSAAAWQLASASDLEYDFVIGDRPEGFEQAQQFSKGLKLLANDDKDVLRTLMEVFHMERSSDDLRTPELAARVMQALST